MYLWISKEVKVNVNNLLGSHEAGTLWIESRTQLNKCVFWTPSSASKSRTDVLSTRRVSTWIELALNYVGSQLPLAGRSSQRMQTTFSPKPRWTVCFTNAWATLLATDFQQRWKLNGYCLQADYCGEPSSNLNRVKRLHVCIGSDKCNKIFSLNEGEKARMEEALGQLILYPAYFLSVHNKCENVLDSKSHSFRLLQWWETK